MESLYSILYYIVLTFVYLSILVPLWICAISSFASLGALIKIFEMLFGSSKNVSEKPKED